MGSLKHWRAAPQSRRFQRCSIPGDAGGPSALDALPSLEHSTVSTDHPDDNEEIMRVMLEQFKEMAKACCTLKVRAFFSCLCVVIQDATSNK